MTIKYRFNEYAIAYGQEYVIDPPMFTDLNMKFSLENYSDIFKIDQNNGSIIINSDIDIGIYDLKILSQNEETTIKIIIKPNITYKIISFYNDGKYNKYLPITNPQNIVGDYKLEENYEYININNITGEISFDENIQAGTYNLVIKCLVKNIELICISTFNIYPIVKYEKEEYTCEKYDSFKSDIPYIKPNGGFFKFSNDYSGITIDYNTGQISINKPKSGGYNLIVVYKINNISTSTNILLNIKPIISYKISVTEHNNLIQFESPTNTDLGGIYTLEQNLFNKNFTINSSNGKITIKNSIPTGQYLIKVFYSLNNCTIETISEILITPNIYYTNNKIDILFGTKYQTEKPESDEEINGLFSLVKTYENIHINPNNGILYFSNYLECGDYCIDINYNKNNVNKIIQYYIKVKPTIKIKNDKQVINYYENLNNVILETNPMGGILTNNLNVPIENNLIKLTEFEKKIGNYELKIKYNFNSIQNSVTYNFCIIPYIIYNINNINIVCKQQYISEAPTVYPYDGIFTLETKVNNIYVDEKTGKINITNGLSVGIYELVIKYTSNNLINTANFKITVKPLFNLKKNTFTYRHNILAIDEKYELEPLDVYPKGGIFSSDIFYVDKNGIISIPSKIDIGEYKINIKYTYFDIDTYFDYILYVIPYKLTCLFKQCEKIYDGKNNVTVKYITNNDIPLNLTYDAEFDNADAGINKKIEIKNIKILDNKNIIHDDTTILGVIKTRKLNIVFTGIEKYYNGCNDATVEYKIDNVIDGDDVHIQSYECFYEVPFVGNNKITISKIILGGNNCKNYHTDSTYETYGKIKPKEAIVTFKRPIMDYTGSTNVTLEIENIEGICNNDKVMIESYVANFETPEFGENISITVKNIKPFKNFNYTFTAKPLFGKINKKEITVSALSTNKIYDGTTKATVTFNCNNLNIISYEANYENKNMGNKKKIYVSNIISNNPNYILKDFIIYGSILPLTLMVKFSGENKVYDGTTNVNGEYEILNKIDNDDITINSIITFKNSNAENNKELIYTIPKLSGQDSNNYKLYTLILNKPHVFKKKIDIEFIGVNKVYDNTTNANVKVVLPDKSIRIKSYNAFFENKDVGDNKKIVISDIVLLNDNYYCETSYTYANIEKKQISVLIEPQHKEYDGNINAEIKIINIIGICFNDNMFITNYKAEFQDPNVGLNKTVTISDFEYGGISSNNYFCKDFTTKANIIKKKVEFEVLNNEKYFDGTTNINITLKTKNNVDIKSFSANFDNFNVGNGKTIYVKNIILDGNYSVSDFMCKGNILPKYIDLNFISKNKVYDGTNKAYVTLTDNYKIKYDAYYEDITVGLNKKIIIKIIDGIIPNYLLYDEYVIYGNITPEEIKLVPIVCDKVFNELSEHKISFDISNNEVIDYYAYFENCNVGTNKKLFITQIKLKDTNYYCKDFVAYGNIVPLCINMNYKVLPKIYDGTTKAIIENSSGISYYEANFSSSNVGKHEVYIKNIILNNKNYIINDCITESDILQKNIPINIIINEKQYDGTRNATIKSYTTSYDVKIIDYDAKFENETIEENKKVVITSVKLDNNNYKCDDMVLFSKITKRQITINFKEINKMYDGTTNAQLEIINLNNIINNENVTVTSFDAHYLSKNCGDTILNLNNIILDGIHVNNYIIEKQKIQTKILKRKLKYLINVTDKKYDGNNYAFINVVLNNIISNEDVYIENFIAQYDDEKIGMGKKITIKNIILGGNDKNNYDIDSEIYLSGNII